mmetsp:Transcript_2378/g.4107  ORF Transcript_2378/g.4107 Transcript_2378/m.4107 type:complete len:105 (-) Transcript_2378:2361-2675(-)
MSNTNLTFGAYVVVHLDLMGCQVSRLQCQSLIRLRETCSAISAGSLVNVGTSGTLLRDMLTRPKGGWKQSKSVSADHREVVVSPLFGLKDDLDPQTTHPGGRDL